MKLVKITSALAASLFLLMASGCDNSCGDNNPVDGDVMAAAVADTAGCKAYKDKNEDGCEYEVDNGGTKETKTLSYKDARVPADCDTIVTPEE